MRDVDARVLRATWYVSYAFPGRLSATPSFSSTTLRDWRQGEKVGETDVKHQHSPEDAIHEVEYRDNGPTTSGLVLRLLIGLWIGGSKGYSPEAVPRGVGRVSQSLLLVDLLGTIGRGRGS